MKEYFSVLWKREELLTDIVRAHTSDEFVRLVKCCQPDALGRLSIQVYESNPDYEYILLDDEVIGCVSKPILEDGEIVIKYHIVEKKE